MENDTVKSINILTTGDISGKEFVTYEILNDGSVYLYQSDSKVYLDKRQLKLLIESYNEEMKEENKNGN